MSPFEVCELLGISFDKKGVTTDGATWDTPWDGKKLNGMKMRSGCPKAQSYQDLFHEIGHWLVAAPERRKYPTFGLGMSYDALPGDLLVRSRVIAIDEEVQASAVGILLHATVADPRGAWRHADDHSWFDHSWFDQRTKDAWFDLQKKCPDRARAALLAAGIELLRDKPKNWRSR